MLGDVNWLRALCQPRLRTGTGDHRASRGRASLGWPLVWRALSVRIFYVSAVLQKNRGFRRRKTCSLQDKQKVTPAATVYGHRRASRKARLSNCARSFVAVFSPLGRPRSVRIFYSRCSLVGRFCGQAPRGAGRRGREALLRRLDTCQEKAACAIGCADRHVTGPARSGMGKAKGKTPPPPLGGGLPEASQVSGFFTSRGCDRKTGGAGVVSRAVCRQNNRLYRPGPFLLSAVPPLRRPEGPISGISPVLFARAFALFSG